MNSTSSDLALRAQGAALATTPARTMTALERRASSALALIFALRMLGLFLILPVFALEARQYPGGDDPLWVGWAMGIYGFTQALLQIPLGLASDRWGRKRIIILGLCLFALGSLVAALSHTLMGLLLGRALQGAGAISAAVTALLADQTRDIVRTKAMALVGASIALVFALSLVMAPPLTAWVGLRGLFVLIGALACVGVAVVLWWVPREPLDFVAQTRGSLRAVLLHPALLRLNLGVFVLHAVQLAMWMAVPALLVQAGVEKQYHGWIYLPVVLVSFLVMGATLFPLERKGYLRAVFLSAIALLVCVQGALLWTAVHTPNVLGLVLVLVAFFSAFNVLEASQPSLASRFAPPWARGAGLGVYNTAQSLGFFTGGALGGWLLHYSGPMGLFATCAAGLLLWLIVAWPMQPPAVAQAVQTPSDTPPILKAG